MQHLVSLSLLLEQTLILMRVSPLMLQHGVHQLEGPSSAQFKEQVLQEGFRVEID
jgi:hypothetical protein